MHPSTRFKELQRRGSRKKVKAKIGSSVVKFCLLYMEWILNSVTHNGCDYLQNIKLAKIPAWIRRRNPRPLPKLRSHWQMIAAGRESFFSWDMASGRFSWWMAPQYGWH